MKRILIVVAVLLAVILIVVGLRGPTQKSVGITTQTSTESQVTATPSVTPTTRPFPVASFTPSLTVVLTAMPTSTTQPTLTVAQAETAVYTLKKALGPDPCGTGYRIVSAMNTVDELSKEDASMIEPNLRIRNMLSIFIVTCKVGPIIADLLKEQ